ncbi:MAG: hypothetical protein JWM25_998 [Thermoleophilia bacterium]|nr:hypothetical protein [Thermoleophilia bacterium]MCZ4496415.1 hypothetical protein [Thermoleophilia bacterium]
MSDLATLGALFLLVLLVESSPAVRLPIGLLLAVGVLASEVELLPVVLVGALGVAIARLGLAMQARRGRDRAEKSSPGAQAQRAAIRQQLAGAPAYARITFLLAALPGVPSGFLFPLLGTMRTPLGPALSGTIVGRIPILAITTAVFTWLGGLLATEDRDAAVALGIFAVLLLVVRTIGQVDWQHRAQTGEWRMRDADEGALRMTSMFTAGQGGPAAGSPFGASPFRAKPIDDSDEDIVEGELLGEEIVEDEPPMRARIDQGEDFPSNDPSDPRSQ